MSRTFDISGKSLIYLFYGSSLAALATLLAFVVSPFDSFASVALAVLFASLLIAAVVGLWRRATGREGEHLGTAEDIAYDPIAYPGQAAKDRWLKAVRRLPGGDDEED
ncbi:MULTISPECIES: hypothetical protein [Halorussus]|uniref:hypothetical protein n=1 Tax=Halorussus TaxID=1070314 RepID=UPI000E211467|nr:MULTISPECIES: hypothetical protein [Halorussus]NHN60986.1 hypothetical protein [Halorussus sp. JP-T4]